jgi:short-subunit dehydrogenase
MAIVITGASSGIGRALALAWAKRKARVVLSARDEGALAKVAEEVRAAGGDAHVCAGDVTVEADRVRLIERALDVGGQIDVLVNNAGRGYYGDAVSLDLAELESLFALNVFAPLRLTQLALDPLTRVSGSVVMMSSIAGVISAPRHGAYSATKFALEALSDSLRAELASAGVRVVVIRPGPVDTPFRERATSVGGRDPEPRAPGARVQTPEEIAEQTVRAVEDGNPVVETSAYVKLASAATRLAPAAWRVVSRAMAARKSH